MSPNPQEIFVGHAEPSALPGELREDEPGKLAAKGHKMIADTMKQSTARASPKPRGVRFLNRKHLMTRSGVRRQSTQTSKTVSARLSQAILSKGHAALI